MQKGIQMRKIARLTCTLCLLLIPACGLLVEKDREVVAEVAGEPIRLRDLQSRIRGLDFQERAKANDSNPEVSFATRRQILGQMVADRLMVLEAESRGLEATDEEISKILQGRVVSDGAVEGIDGGASGGAGDHEEREPAQWEIEEAKSKLLIEKLADEELSEAAMRKYYEEHPEEFALNSPLVKYEIISVTLDKSEIVDTVYRLMIEKGMKMAPAFETLGKPAQILGMGGITPTMSLDELPPSLRENVEGLRKNDLSRPFYYHADDGVEYYAITRCVRFLTKRPYKTVKEELHNKLPLQLIRRLQNKFEVVYYDEELKYRVER